MDGLELIAIIVLLRNLEVWQVYGPKVECTAKQSQDNVNHE